MNDYLSPQAGHLTGDDLIDRLYGTASAEANAHFERCVECGERLRALELRRADSAAMPVISEAALAKQRRAILNRVESPGASRIKWVPAFAAACLLVVVALVYQPSEPVAVPNSEKIAKAAPEISDKELFSELYAIEQREEPRAAAPIHQLFESSAGVSVQ
jgi:hypothetical protein